MKEKLIVHRASFDTGSSIMQGIGDETYRSIVWDGREKILKSAVTQVSRRPPFQNSPSYGNAIILQSQRMEVEDSSGRVTNNEGKTYSKVRCTSFVGSLMRMPNCHVTQMLGWSTGLPWSRHNRSGTGQRTERSGMENIGQCSIYGQDGTNRIVGRFAKLWPCFLKCWNHGYHHDALRKNDFRKRRTFPASIGCWRLLKGFVGISLGDRRDGYPMSFQLPTSNNVEFTVDPFHYHTPYKNPCRCRNTLLALAGSTAGTVTSKVPPSTTSVTTTATTTTTTRSTSSTNSILDDGLSRGDARGAAIRLEGVSISRGNSQILKDIDWRIEPKAKWGLIGANGCGKSTLLKAIMEEISYDGKITIGTTQTVGYLQQTAVSGSRKSVFEEAASAMKGIQAARDELYLAEQAVASHDETDTTSSSSTSTSVSSNNNDKKKKSTLEQDLDRLDQAIRQYEQLGGYEQEKQVGEMLHGLGFTNLTQPCNELSGGWQMRVSFAKLLLSKPSLALLDEPSNHLDRPARSWLAQYLRQYTDGAMILVTHDKELLESCQHIAEITSAGTMQVYKSCTYPQYLALKEERAKQALSEYQKNAEKAAKLQTFVDKYGASATKASAAQSRVKQIDKMKAEGLLDAPSDDILEQRYKPRLNLPPPPKAMGDVLLALSNEAMVGYRDENSRTILPLISKVNLEIQRGMKILIRGPNGAGKTTLLDTLRGTLPLLQGNRIENDALRLGVFTQDLAQELDTSRRAVDLVTEYARGGDDGDIHISDQQARTVLGGLGLTGDKALRKVGELSGGEKARVALGMFALKPSNLYLLDEVSNHLDIECVEALSEALSEWGGEEGSLVVISHDKTFCEQVGFSHVLTIQDDGTLKLEQRNTNESDWDTSKSTLQRFSQQDNGGSGEANPPARLMDEKLRKQAYNAPKRISKIESLIEEKESKIALLDEEMMTVGIDLTKKKEGLEAEVTKLMKEWEELEGLLAELEESG
ncbi:ABC transporter related protein [Nitzschia inconspicua]|uniref:ABC transporter related protein n=1 Tax=Nitzschia inconspicua TaxID=303405 RepID=A0A9K3PUJ6_9STRA|nr:ABC transporter related protein [Nitzschia inconspicua]